MSSYTRRSLNGIWVDEYIDILLMGAAKADSYWHKCREIGEPFCYGRNDIGLNLYYAETGNVWQVYHQTIIPKEVWSIPNTIYSKLIRFK